MAEHMELQERLDHTQKLFTSALDRFNACRKQAPSVNRELEQQLTAYADGLTDWLAGNIQWSSVNHRYNTFLDEKDRKNNIMRLDLDSPHRKLQRFLLIFFVALIVSLCVYLLL